jgi:hypothetical protein
MMWRGLSLAREESTTSPTVLSKARITPVNAMIVKAVAMEAWNAFHSSKGDDRARNPIGALIFNSTDGSRNSRVAMAGKVQIPL